MSKNRKLCSAKFEFEKFKVFFIGPKIVLTDPLENQIAHANNPWRGDGNENKLDVNNREFKPLARHAFELIGRLQEKRWPFHTLAEVDHG